MTYDLVAEGETLSEVLNSLERVIRIQIAFDLRNGIEPFSAFASAPKEYWQQYEDISESEIKAFAFNVQSEAEHEQEGDSDLLSVSGVGMMKLAA
ncbi:MAG: hypothetical protein JO170_04235 [Verrucomicrobia bacterium]|nr:hypothetical protein [Verrucomicrobiota bacterium]